MSTRLPSVTFDVLERFVREHRSIALADLIVGARFKVKELPLEPKIFVNGIHACTVPTEGRTLLEEFEYRASLLESNSDRKYQYDINEGMSFTVVGFDMSPEAVTRSRKEDPRIDPTELGLIELEWEPTTEDGRRLKLRNTFSIMRVLDKCEKAEEA